MVLNMKKRIVAIFLVAALCLTMFPVSASASFDWAGWEISENQDDPTYSVIRYRAPFQDATFDEIVYCISHVLSEYITMAGSQTVWQNRQVVFSYSSDKTLDAVLNEQKNTILGANNNRFTDTILIFNNRVFNHSGIGNSAVVMISAQSQSHLRELWIDFSNSMVFGDDIRQKRTEVRQRLIEIVSAAKAYSSTEYGQLEYINKYLIDNVRYGSGDSESDWGQTTYETIMLGNAVCGGYTAAVQDLCFLLGIPSIILRGNKHVWNYVYVDGQWKMLDVTWNDSTGSEKRYFLVDSISTDTHNIARYDDSRIIDIAKDFVLKLHGKIEYVIVGGKPIHPSEAPSSWAVGQLNTAIAAGFVPQSLQSRYTQPITRAEFCALAVTLYEKFTGNEMTGRKAFDDTNDVNVEKMAAVGIVDGIGDNRFDPDGVLNREQAATMLSRLANALGKPLSDHAAAFADNNSISSWAIQGAGQVQVEGIMTGVSDNAFAPKSPYTREQSITTMMRLWSRMSD